MAFPIAGAQVYYNEAGEPLGWDYPDEGPDPDDFDAYDDENFEPDDEDEECDEEYDVDIHDPAHERDGIADRDPHPTHCCQRHGCKYGSGDMCSVARIDRPGRAQIYPCEQCCDDMDDDRADAEAMNALYDLAYARGREKQAPRDLRLDFGRGVTGATS